MSEAIEIERGADGQVTKITFPDSWVKLFQALALMVGNEANKQPR